MVWFVISEILYTIVIISSIVFIFLRKYNKIRAECFEKVIGKLHIEPPLPGSGEQSGMYLELYKGEGNLSHKELVYLEVDRDSYLSHK